ncbi:hypothetical protein VTJ04DRAFT_10334 [Mycothermus thermophilus]|uniref:uncharacterized protein n=1 Tax=Humicola insolens TaxID=85995 RepID=UPI0037441F6E
MAGAETNGDKKALQLARDGDASIAEFKYFLSVPPEIRVMVYDLALDLPMKVISTPFKVAKIGRNALSVTRIEYRPLHPVGEEEGYASRIMELRPQVPNLHSMRVVYNPMMFESWGAEEEHIRFIDPWMNITRIVSVVRVLYLFDRDEGNIDVELSYLCPGPGLIRAREVYTKCIRNAIAYGASSFHAPTPPGGRPQGISQSLSRAQNRNLRVVTGAYRATPTYTLETEAWVPPLDLYLNKRLADFEKRIQQPDLPGGMKPAEIIANACARLYRRFRKPRGRRGAQRAQGPQEPTEVEKRALEVARWTRGRPAEEALREAWEQRWKQRIQAQGRRPGRPTDWDPPPISYSLIGPLLATRA